VICTFSTQKLITTHVIAVRRGDRIAQLILERIITPEVEEVSELDETNRGANGYGSTGINTVKP
jgi:dUTPase